uniref:OCRE domain-containing protein n=1 Tax=Steinernema glaseri TaxID=37863 RepID=A0A1I7Y8W5_9BILA
MKISFVDWHEHSLAAPFEDGLDGTYLSNNDGMEAVHGPGFIYTETGHPIVTYTYDEHGGYYDEYGNYTDAAGHLHPPNQVYYAEPPHGHTSGCPHQQHVGGYPTQGLVGAMDQLRVSEEESAEHLTPEQVQQITSSAQFGRLPAGAYIPSHQQFGRLPKGAYIPSHEQSQSKVKKLTREEKNRIAEQYADELNKLGPNTRRLREEELGLKKVRKPRILQYSNQTYISTPAGDNYVYPYFLRKRYPGYVRDIEEIEGSYDPELQETNPPKPLHERDPNLKYPKPYVGLHPKEKKRGGPSGSGK